MRIRRRDDEDYDLRDEQEPDPAPEQERHYWKVTARMTGASKYANEWVWTFGKDAVDDEAQTKAVLLAAEIMGDGSGIYRSEDGSCIQRRHLVCVNVQSWPVR